MAAQLKSYSTKNGCARDELLHDRHLVHPIIVEVGGTSGDIDKSQTATQEKLNVSKTLRGRELMYCSHIPEEKKHI